MGEMKEEGGGRCCRNMVEEDEGRGLKKMVEEDGDGDD